MSKQSGLAILKMGYEDDIGNFDADRTVVWSVIPRSSLSGLVLGTLKPHMPKLQPISDLALLVAQHDAPDCIVSVADVLHTDDFRRWRRQAQERRGRTMAVIEITPDR